MKKIQSVLLFLIMITGGSVAIFSMEFAAALTQTLYMHDTTASAGLSTYSGRQIQAEYVTGASSLVGKQIDTITVQLKKAGLSTGIVQIGAFNTDLSAKKLFGTKDASTLSGTYTDYTFSLPILDKPYLIQSGDRLGIKFTGGNSVTYVAIMTDRTNAFDGVNSYQTYYTTSWNTYQTEDLYMTLKLSTTPLPTDTTPPVITLRGSSVVSIQQGLTYLDAGATATDNVDGNITSNIMTTNPVNTSLLGNYTVTYNVHDAVGNVAAQVTRTVKVVDTVPPTVTASPSGSTFTLTQSVTLTASEPATIYYTTDGTIPTTSGSVYSSTISISTSKTLKFFAKDASGNTGTVITQTYIINTTNSNLRVDSNGIQMFYTQKTGKQSIIMGTGNPNNIPGFVLDGGSKAVAKTHGQFHYYTITPRVGKLSSGGTQLTMRINLNPLGSSGTQSTWQIAEQNGYLVTPNDIDEFEQTGYFRINNVTNNDDISLKQGGQHTSSNPSWAGTFGMEIAYDGVYGKTAEKELNYPKYEFFNEPVSLHTGNIAGKWIGVKEISVHVPVPFTGLCTSTNPCQAQLYKIYLDLDPIDFTTGKPKNNWKFFSTHLDDGKESGIYTGHKTTWGKKFFTWRIDNAKNIDFALLSIHHIDSTTGQNIPG